MTKISKALILAGFMVLFSSCGKGGTTSTGTTTAYLGSGSVSASGVTSACTVITSPVAYGGNFALSGANISSSATATPTTSATATATFSGSGSDGTISLQAQFYGSTFAAGSGQYQMSNLYVAVLVYQIQTGQIALSGYTPGTSITASQLCISVTSVNITRYNAILYNGQIQLLLNGVTPIVAYF